MPTDDHAKVSGRKLGLFGLVAGVALVFVVVSGIRAREDSDVKLKEWTDDQATPTVAVIPPDARVSGRKLGLFALAAGLALVLVVVSGIRAREQSDARLKQWTDDPDKAEFAAGDRLCLNQLGLSGHATTPASLPLARALASCGPY